MRMGRMPRKTDFGDLDVDRLEAGPAPGVLPGVLRQMALRNPIELDRTLPGPLEFGIFCCRSR